MRRRGRAAGRSRAADDRADAVVHLDRAPERRAVGGVPALPDAVADDDDRLRARRIVGRDGVAPELRPLADHLEQRGGAVRARVLLGGAALLADVQRRPSQHAEAGQRARAALPIEEVEARHAEESPSASVIVIEMIESGSANGRPRRTTACAKVKTVVFTPIPRASASAATAVNHLSLTRIRTAKRTSCHRVTDPRFEPTTAALIR